MKISIDHLARLRISSFTRDQKEKVDPSKFIIISKFSLEKHLTLTWFTFHHRRIIRINCHSEHSWTSAGGSRLNLNFVCSWRGPLNSSGCDEVNLHFGNRSHLIWGMPRPTCGVIVKVGIETGEGFWPPNESETAADAPVVGVVGNILSQN